MWHHVHNHHVHNMAKLHGMPILEFGCIMIQLKELDTKIKATKNSCESDSEILDQILEYTERVSELHSKLLNMVSDELVILKVTTGMDTAPDGTPKVESCEFLNKE